MEEPPADHGSSGQENRQISSESLAALIVDALFDAGIVAKGQVEAAIVIVTEEIDSRKALGDY